MYDAPVRAGVLARLDAGESLRGVSIATGISRATLREWRERDGAFAARHECPCPSCRGTPPPLNPYLYLLGQYLGGITRQWLHLFPQHGPGVKHERAIVLEAWQRDLVETDPRPLIRGLIHSDGWRGTNWTTKTVGGTTKRYTYPRYQFSNRSDDIRGIFTDALDRLGIAWRQSNRWTISVARRDAVAALDEFIGPKH